MKKNFLNSFPISVLLLKYLLLQAYKHELAEVSNYLICSISFRVIFSHSQKKRELQWMYLTMHIENKVLLGKLYFESIEKLHQTIRALTEIKIITAEPNFKWTTN